MSAPKVYIAGPMTGYPEHNYPAFHAAAAQLRQLGYQVENPAEHDLPDNASWQAHLRHSITRMLMCDAVLLLPGFSKSSGAAIEYQLACDLDIPVAWLSDVIEGAKIL
jgi:hypothetical protein